MMIAVDEAYQFVKNMVNNCTNIITVQRMCRLFEGGWWSKTHKLKCKRTRIQLLYSGQLKNKDGFNDRFLITLSKKITDVYYQFGLRINLKKLKGYLIIMEIIMFRGIKAARYIKDIIIYLKYLKY